MIKMDGKLVVILDFEAILSSISPETGLRVNDIEQIGERSRSEDTILIAEDSPLPVSYTHLLFPDLFQDFWIIVRVSA